MAGPMDEEFMQKAKAFIAMHKHFDSEGTAVFLAKEFEAIWDEGWRAAFSYEAQARAEHQSILGGCNETGYR